VWWSLTREIIMFSIGLSVFVVETTHPGEPRKMVLLACGLLIGLPVASYIDRWLGGNR
jgi:hypothetical protein